LKPADLQKIYRRQAAWFAGERSRLLRKVNIASKRRVLDLGAGTGETLCELDRRARGFAVGVDSEIGTLRLAAGRRVAGQAESLPFQNATFDLVFTQMFFLWARPLKEILAELRRVLAPGGHLIAAAEPDYSGAVEHPTEHGQMGRLAETLAADGADIEIGRKLGGELMRAGFRVACGVHPARPLESALPDSIFAVPELVELTDGLEFLFLPYFHFLAVRV